MSLAGKVRVRMYRVGFGDFFLVTVPTPKGPRHILVDCGVHAGDIHSMGAAVADMAEATGRHLSLVIATHRHADHISGFATCAETFREFTVDMVWMSSWDDPDAPKAVALQARIAALAERIQSRMALAASDDPVSVQAAHMAANALGEPLAAAGAKGLRGNAAALAMLRGRPKSDVFHFKNEPLRRYYKAGDPPELPPDLVAASVSATIVGPPTDPEIVARMDNAARQYLRLTQDEAGATGLSPFGKEWEVEGSQYLAEASKPFATREALRAAVAGFKSDTLLAAAKTADQAINNQSLVVHFRVKDKTLLFVGDAQWGSWSSFLFGKLVSGMDAAPIRAETRALLADLDFYKVGHHGSTNSTPIDAVAALGTHCVAMCSTEIDCYGSEDNRSEVPRIPLLGALAKRTKGRIARSDQVAAGDEAASGEKLAKEFVSSGTLFIDHFL